MEKRRNNRKQTTYFVPAILILVAATLAGCSSHTVPSVESRKEVTYLRGPYNTSFYRRHNASERYSAGFHYHHGKQQDVLQITPLSNRQKVDADFDESVVKHVSQADIRVGPSMEFFGPYASRIAWKVYRAIDWTHEHHEQTYDIMASKKISWDKKKQWTDRAVKYYLEKNKDVARTIAPLDITMRRAAVMMKPYFTFYRNYYPKSNGDAWVAHWWHPAIYEAMMIAGNGDEQEKMIKATNDLMFNSVFKERPQRMLLSRELMPRYSRLSPESANIFDNLHMLHGIVFDILAYEGWTDAQKQAEIYRFIDAMSYHPGDEKYVRKFSEPHPDLDPRVYEDWMKGSEGEMSRIMMEMMDEMMPLMMPQGMAPDMKEKMMAQFKMKTQPGMQDGEIEGSLHDALMKMMPGMKMMPEAMEPGKTPQMMVDAMLKGWTEKYGNMPDIAPYPMDKEPSSVPALATNH